MHLLRKPHRAVFLFAGPGKGLRFKLLFEHQKTPELDFFGPPARLVVTVHFVSSLKGRDRDSSNLKSFLFC